MNIKKHMNSLLIAVFVMHLADYLVIPLLPVILSIDEKFNASQVGMILAIGALFFQFGSVAGGFLSDKMGRKLTITIGAIIQIGAMFGFGLSHHYMAFLLFSGLNNLGGGFYAPTIKASISEHASQSNTQRTAAFSWRGAMANLGIVVAGLITLLFVKENSKYVFFTSALIYVALLLLSIFFIPNKCYQSQFGEVKKNQYKQILKNKPFLLFCIVSLFTWAVYSQLNLLLPLRAGTILKNGKYVGSIWTITSLFVVFFQTLISKFILQKIQMFSSILIGVLIMGTGIFLIGFTHNYLGLLFSATIFIIGEMFSTPTLDSITGSLAEKSVVGAYFSIGNVLYGLGSALGNFVGGSIINYYGIDTSLTPWAIVFALAIGITIIIFFMKQIPTIKQALDH